MCGGGSPGIVCAQSLTALRRVLQVVVDKTAYRVSGIRLMQTSMINTKTKQKLYMPNVVLARMFIENDERSPHARATVRGCCGRVCVWRVRAAGDLCCRSAQVDIYVDPGVTALQIKLLHERLTDFMRHESPDDWMQPAEPYVIASDVRVRCVPCAAAREDARAWHHARCVHAAAVRWQGVPQHLGVDVDPVVQAQGRQQGTRHHHGGRAARASRHGRAA